MKSKEFTLKKTKETNLIPCIINQCIVYPACKHRRKIRCDIISDYMSSLTKDFGSYPAWNHIHKWMPVAVSIYNSKGDQGDRYFNEG